MFVAQASGNGTRTGYRNRSSNAVGIKEQLCNINEGILPFQSTNGEISVRDAILLTQKAYFNVSAFRNTIDVQSEFANCKLHFTGASARSRNFYEAWYKKINGPKLQDQYFREYYRSSCFYTYKTFYTIGPEDLKKLKDEYGGSEVPSDLLGKKIPLRYVVLNPADITYPESFNLSNGGIYSKILTGFELEKLRKPTTLEEKRFLASLPAETRTQIKSGGCPSVPLDATRFGAVFAKKQDYEPFAVPIYYPVLFDINLKLEFKKAEIAVAKTIDYLVLMVTFGDKEIGIDPKVGDALKTLFSRESVSRVVVSDYTTKAEFIIPDLNKILGPDKYEVVNRDIANGLMNIFFEDQKFASGLIKTKIFLERLNEAQRTYVQDFLVPEMELIANELGFREVPVPEFEKVSLEDEAQVQKVYTRLVELGLLTPDEFFEVNKTGMMPNKEGSLESQKEFKKLKDDGLYAPLIGGSTPDEAGRPNGTKAPQTTKKVSPQKGIGYDFNKIKSISHDISKINEMVEDEFKKRKGLKRISEKNKAVAFEFTKKIISGQSKQDWESSVALAFDGVLKDDLEVVEAVSNLQAEHDLDSVAATILLNSKNELDTTETN